MGEGTRNLSGTRTDGSAHNLIRAVSGIEMALWDLAGKILDVPDIDTARREVPRSRARVRSRRAEEHARQGRVQGVGGAASRRIRAGFTSHKFGFPHTEPDRRISRRDPSNRMLSTRELINIQQGFENCREAIGWDHDIMVHCHWEYDLRTSIQIADAVESIKPL